MKIVKLSTLLGVASVALLVGVNNVAVAEDNSSDDQASTASNSKDKGKKIEICHNVAQNPVIIEINENALSAHIGPDVVGQGHEGDFVITPENRASCAKPAVPGDIVVSIKCKADVCKSLPEKDILVEPLNDKYLPTSVPVHCTVKVTTKKNSVSGAEAQEVAASEIAVTLPSGETMTLAASKSGDPGFDLMVEADNPLKLLGIVQANTANIANITPTEVDAIRTATYALLPTTGQYKITISTQYGKDVHTGSVDLLTQKDVEVNYVTLDHSHGTGHVQFSFYEDGCTITDGEDAVPMGLRVWQPMPELISVFPRGILPGDMFSPGVHYKNATPDQAEYILEKIDDAGKSTFEPVTQVK